MKKNYGMFDAAEGFPPGDVATSHYAARAQNSLEYNVDCGLITKPAQVMLCEGEGGGRRRRRRRRRRREWRNERLRGGLATQT